MTQLLQLSGDEAAEQRPLGWRQGSTRALCSPDTGERVWGKGSSPCSWHKKPTAQNCSAQTPASPRTRPHVNTNPILLQLLGLQEAFISSLQSSLVFLVRYQPVGMTEAHPTGRAGGNNTSPPLLPCQEAQTLPELPRERGSHLLAQPSEHLAPAETRLGPLISQQRDLSAKRSFFPPGPRPQEGRAAHAPSPTASPPSSAGPAARSTRGRLRRAGPRRHLGPRLPWCGGGRRLGAGPARLAAGCLPPAR